MTAEPAGRLGKAKALIAAGQDAKAEPLLRHLVKAAPGKPLPLLLLAELRRRAGDKAEAEALFRQLLARNPGQPKAGLGLARLLVAERRPDEAETVLRAVIAAAPDHAEARLLLVDLRRRHRDHAEVEALLREGWAASPGHPALGLAFAELLAGRKQFTEAEPVLRAVLEAAPHRIEARLLLADARQRLGDLPEAEALLRAGLSLRPDATGLTLALAQLLAQHRRSDEAETVLRQALDATPDEPELLVALGKRLAAGRRLAEAAEIYERATLTPASPSAAWIGLATAAGRLSTTRVTLEKLVQALKVKRDDPEVYFALGNELLHVGLFAEAGRVVAAGLARAPGHLMLSALAIKLDTVAGRFDEATAAIARLPARTRQEKRLKTRQAASVMKAQWRIDEALDLYRTAEPQALDPPTHRLLADLHLMALDVGGTRRQLRELNRGSSQRRALNVSQGLVGEIANDFWTDPQALAAGQAARRAASLSGWTGTVRAHPNHTGCAIGFMIHLRQTGRLDVRPAGPDIFPIPRHIHQFWDTPEIPDDVAELMQDWRRYNPGWRYTRHTLASARAWLRQRPDERLGRAFRHIAAVAGKADLLRLAVLFEEGGVYADADDRCLGPLDTLVAGRDLVLRQEHYGSVGNNFIAVKPGHPVIGQALEEAVEATLRGDRESIWLSSGPGLITRVLANYLAAEPRRIDGLGRGVLLLDQPALTRFCASGCRVSYKHSDRNWQASEFRKLSAASGPVRLATARPAMAPDAAGDGGAPSDTAA